MAEKTLVINNDLRTITVPEGVKSLGVEFDEDVLRLHFSMPKMYGDIDLSAFAIRINYLNANGEGDVYRVEDKTVAGENITFSWLVSRFVTQRKGAVRFIVCLKELDDTGKVLREFNTTPTTLQVLEGLETTDAVEQEHPDILEQIQERLAALEASASGCNCPPIMLVKLQYVNEYYANAFDYDNPDMPVCSYCANGYKADKTRAEIRNAVDSGTLVFATVSGNGEIHQHPDIALDTDEMGNELLLIGDLKPMTLLNVVGQSNYDRYEFETNITNDPYMWVGEVRQDL